MLLSNNLESAAACVLIETLNKFPAIPNKNNAMANNVVVCAKPKEIRDNGYKMEAIITMRLLPCLAVKLPEIGIPTKDPIGRKNKMPPKAPSLKPNCILISGILLAQLAKQIPVKKKKPDKTMRLVRFEIREWVIAQR